MNQINHRHIDVNGIRMHIAEQGQGPLVLMVQWLSRAVVQLTAI